MKKNEHVIEITIDGEKWEKALDKAFNKKNKDVAIPGFRKGNAPKDVFIKKYGEGVLYESAVDSLLNEVYKTVLKDNDLIPVTEPSVDVTKLDKDGVTYKFTVITAPDVVLGDYKNLKIKKEKATATKEEVKTELDNLVNQLAELAVKENGEVANGDTATIDFEGFMEGVPFEGGKGENYPLQIGSNSFIPGFEEALIGLKKGETKDINLKFPKNYVKDLAGKEVTFKVTIREVKERILPEINEEFFKDLGYDNIKTKEELESEIEKNIIDRKNAKIEDEYIEKCLEKASNNMKIDINDELISDEVHRMIHQFEDRLKSQGMTMEHYHEMTGTSHDDLHKQMESEATKRVKYRYLIEKVAEVEKIEFTEDEVNAKTKELADNYGVSEEELLKAYGNKELIKYDMKMHKALEIIKSEE